MAILKMSKFNLVVFDTDKKKVLDILQRFKEVDFESVDASSLECEKYSSKDLETIDDKLIKLNDVIKKIRRYCEPKSSLQRLKEGNINISYNRLIKTVEGSSYDQLTDTILKELSNIEKNTKHIESLKNKYREYSNYQNLDVSMEDVKSLKKVDMLLATVSAKNKEKLLDLLSDKLCYIESIIENTKEYTFALIYFKDEAEQIDEILKEASFIKQNIKLDKKAKEYMKEIEIQIDTLEFDVKKSESKLKKLAEKVQILELAYEYFSNSKIREQATEKFVKTEKVFMIKGYIPEKRNIEFEKMLSQELSNNMYISYEEFDKDDINVPIKLKNNKFVEPFEDLVKTYSMPRYNELDPSLIVAIFYWIFFGMMVADAGYGIVIAIITGVVLKTCNLSETVRRFIKFIFYLSFSIILWGIINGTYFSLNIQVPRLIDPVKDYSQIMAMSVIFGIIQVFIGFGIKAYNMIINGETIDAVIDVGLWYVTLTATILVLIQYATKSSSNVFVIAKYTMYVSMILIVLTAGRKLKGFGAKLGVGVYTLYGITGYFGDFISYIRLMAIGLSGGFIAQSVNIICTMIGFKGLTLIAVMVVFVLGQTVNLLLSMLSAYVHSARLTYVEFFGKFYNGGGRAFNDFKIKEKYINLIDKK